MIKKIEFIKRKTIEHSKKTALLLGALSVLALPPFYQFYILLLTFPILLFLLENSKNGKQAFWIGYAFGFTFFAFGFSWIGNALLIDATTFGWLYPFVLLGSGSFFSFFIAIPAYLASKFESRYSKIFAFASLWTIFEWIRSFLLTGFPWNLLGSVLAFDNNLVQFADTIGTYGLSMLTIIFCSSPFTLINNYNKETFRKLKYIVIIIPSFLYLYGYHKTNNETFSEKSDIKIRIVQPSIQQQLKWEEDSLENNFKTYIEMSQAEGMNDIDFTIWGETASPFPLNLDKEHLAEVTKAIPEKGHLITGSIRYGYDHNINQFRPANSLFVIDKSGKILDIYNKSHLVPFGEYIPLQKYLPDWITPVTQVVGNFIQGNGNRAIKVPEKPSFGPLICYEIIFPHQIINKEDRPEWIINITNDGWYGDSAGPHQHLVITRMRAIEEGITIVRTANSGISAVISKNGDILDSLSLNQKGYIDSYLPKNIQKTTLYSKFGNLPILILCLTNIIIAFFLRKNKRTTFCNI